VGYWLVPFVNLVKPYLIVRSLVRALGGERLAASLHVGNWWLAYLLMGMFGGLQRQLSIGPVLPGFLGAPRLLADVSTSLCTVTTVLFCVRIIRAVQERLEARRSGGSTTAAAAAA
jgi:hypothetical protein